MEGAVNRRALLLGAAAAVAAGAGCAIWVGCSGNAERAAIRTASVLLDPARPETAIPVEGFLYEPETGSPERLLALSAFRGALGLEADAEGKARFRERGAAFLVDRESEAEVEALVPGTGVPSVRLRTGPDGRFAGSITLPADALRSRLVDRGFTRGWLPVAILSTDPPGEGWVQCLGPEGTTVVSDIDDTVKDTQVLDREEMLANTFLREFRAVPGMAAAYDRWAREGAAFHWLSAGPVPLQGFLEEFLADEGFPAGAFTMREFRWSKGPIDDLLHGDPAAFKGRVLDGLAERFPRRRFVLVGDSGERDPEAYGAFARRHPGRVAGILIREVHPGGAPPVRYERAFEGLEPGAWRVFTDPGTLGGLPR
ncbi:MAG: DUF2183 domain-containing protein [Planctomycetes bacterium]|nr:DUF2183 domain-containing protein [Planctomycetota bacterium]